jgi:hypothetical protein
MKNLKPRTRPAPADVLAVAAQTAPAQPPAQMETSDRPTTLNLRFRETTIGAITETAKARRLTIKQIVAQALAEAGIAVAAADLEDRTPRRGVKRTNATPQRYNGVTP